jgi:acetyl-CoA C-acetyltransferase
MKMQNIYIVKAKRTAIGNFLGSLSQIPAHMLSAKLIEHILQDVDKNIIDEVILGQVLQGGVGQNSARQALINAGLSYEKPATTINKVCGSGLKSIIFACDSIAAKRNNLVIAGGHENMSLAMHAVYLRQGLKYGNASQIDLIMRDGLSDAFSNKMMGVTAENIAKKYNISRVEQDEFSYASQNKAKFARDNGYFEGEILKITTNLGEFSKDEFIKDNSNLEKLAQLKPVFDSNGSVTAGNSSGINDGAAVLLVASEDAVNLHKLEPLARIISFASSGVDPELMGTGPIFAVNAALKMAGWSLSDLDLIESNEAFAAQAICVMRELGFDEHKVNICGGAIALGHPIGASGARILVTLIHQMHRTGARKGLATLCVGGGMGVAICIEM